MATRIDDLDVGNNWVPLLWKMPVSPDFNKNIKTNSATMKSLIGSRRLKATEVASYLLS
jgi:leucyl aminopeptidase